MHIPRLRAMLLSVSPFRTVYGRTVNAFVATFLPMRPADTGRICTQRAVSHAALIDLQDPAFPLLMFAAQFSSSADVGTLQAI